MLPTARAFERIVLSPRLLALFQKINYIFGLEAPIGDVVVAGRVVHHDLVAGGLGLVLVCEHFLPGWWLLAGTRHHSRLGQVSPWRLQGYVPLRLIGELRVADRLVVLTIRWGELL